MMKMVKIRETRERTMDKRKRIGRIAPTQP